MNNIRPVSDLRNNFPEISKTVHETEQVNPKMYKLEFLPLAVH